MKITPKLEVSAKAALPERKRRPALAIVCRKVPRAGRQRFEALRGEEEVSLAMEWNRFMNS
jgi:hypothetical protein